MKKFKRFAYLLLIATIIILFIMVYSSTTSDSSSNAQEKALSEVQFLESKLIYMFNSLNNIEFENYRITSEEISEKSKQSSQSSSSAGSGGDSQGEGGSESESGNSSDSSESSASESTTSLDETKKYNLNMKGILTSNDEINWNYIKNEAEILQNSISTIILDLYDIGITNSDVLGFNKEFDNLLIQIKNEDKENTLKELSLLYSYIPRFLKYCDINDEYLIVINTKLNIFNAYSILDTEDWNTINQYILTANKEFSRLLTDIKYNNKNQSIVNKCYITLNGLQNAIEMQDREIFLIKYRNLLEDLNNI